MGTLLYPPYLQWEVVSDCNHKCIHCYNYWRADGMSVETCAKFDEITTQIIERKPLYLAITGGEPMLVFSHIQPCISRMRAAGITVSISTNGTLITEEIARYLSENHIDLVISLPSIDRKICDSVCCAENVVGKLEKVFPLLKENHISTTINVVINKLNISTLYDTLKAINGWGFVARVGMAQRPINASSEYLKYELDKADFKNIVRQTLNAKRDFRMDVDFSVCIPDCAFGSEDGVEEIQKGDCFAGTIAYAIDTAGNVKACQCDTRTYGNILTDSFEEIYKNMSEWRNGSLIPDECKKCNKVRSCRGGCRVESYANTGDYKSLPTFADLKNVPVAAAKNAEILDFSDDAEFSLEPKTVFLKDKECYRVSVGFVATHLSNDFANWLMENHSFKFDDLQKATPAPRAQLLAVLKMLLNNGIIHIQK